MCTMIFFPVHRIFYSAVLNIITEIAEIFKQSISSFFFLFFAKQGRVASDAPTRIQTVNNETRRVYIVFVRGSRIFKAIFIPFRPTPEHFLEHRRSIVFPRFKYTHRSFVSYQYWLHAFFYFLFGFQISYTIQKSFVR